MFLVKSLSLNIWYIFAVNKIWGEDLQIIYIFLIYSSVTILPGLIIKIILLSSGKIYDFGFKRDPLHC